MDHEVYSWITTPIIFGIWLYITISAIRAYSQLMKVKGLSIFMTKKEIKSISDPAVLEAIGKCKRKTRKLSLIWGVIVFIFFILSVIVNKTIGFKN